MGKNFPIKLREESDEKYNPAAGSAAGLLGCVLLVVTVLRCLHVTAIYRPTPALQLLTFTTWWRSAQDFNTLFTPLSSDFESSNFAEKLNSPL